MAISVREPESKFTPAPEGLWQAVCCDVVERPQVQTQWGTKDKVELRWQIDQINEDTGRPFDVRAHYTATLSEKSNLRKMLEVWRGRKFSGEELKGFDLEKLIGVNCQIQVVHNVTDEGKTYANVQAVIAHNPKLPKIRISQDYVREKDRAPKDGAPPQDVFTSDEILDPCPF